MRVIGFSLLTLLFLAGVLWLGLGQPTPVELHGRSFHETSFEERVGGKRFLVPYHHSFRTERNLLWDIAGFLWGEDEEPSSFLVNFSAAWLSAHIDGFQPVLNNRLEGDTVMIWPRRDESPLRPIDADLWYGRDYESGRVVLEHREPNTGMQIIIYDTILAVHSHSHVTAIDPFSNPRFLSPYLIDTPPRPDRDYPQDPPWRVQVCRHYAPWYLKALDEDVRKTTFCAWHFHVIDGVTFDVDLSGENLSLRSEVGHAISREVIRWMLMAEEG